MRKRRGWVTRKREQSATGVKPARALRPRTSGREKLTECKTYVTEKHYELDG